MYHRIFIFVLCALYFVGCTKSDETKDTDFPLAGGKDEIFIDDNTDITQADPAEGSAVAGDFPDDEDDSSGDGPDDEDAFEASGEGSGGGYVPDKDRESPVVAPTVTETTVRKPEPPPDEDDVNARIPGGPAPKPMTTSTTPKVPDIDSNTVPDVPSKHTTTTERSPRKDYSPTDDDNQSPNEVMGRKSEERPTSFFSQPGILAAVIGGAVVGLLCAILLVMFIVYRMRKKDEGSYALDEQKRSSPRNAPYQPPNKEFYA